MNDYLKLILDNGKIIYINTQMIYSIAERDGIIRVNCKGEQIPYTAVAVGGVCGLFDAIPDKYHEQT